VVTRGCTVPQVTGPVSSRPYMPGYLAADAGGILDWSWAEERLVASHCYWVATTWPDGRPHVSPVWGAWFEGCLWFSCHPTSRKAKNIAANPACSATTDNPLEPVVVDGHASQVVDRDEVLRYVAAERSKYAAEWDEAVFTVEFFAPGTFRVAPATVFALDERAFATSPTRWTFGT